MNRSELMPQFYPKCSAVGDPGEVRAKLQQLGVPTVRYIYTCMIDVIRIPTEYYRVDVYTNSTVHLYMYDRCYTHFYRVPTVRYIYTCMIDVIHIPTEYQQYGAFIHV